MPAYICKLGGSEPRALPTSRRTALPGSSFKTCHWRKVWLHAAAGIPARVRTHDVTKQVEYIGNVQNLVEKLSDLPAGGQILMAALTYQRIYGRCAAARSQ